METEVLDNPVITDSEGDALLQQAEEAGRIGQGVDSEGIPEQEAPTEPTTEEPKPDKTKPDNSETAPEKAEETPEQKAERERDEKGRFKKAEAEKEDKPEVSEFEQKKRDKAAKEKERQDRSWQRLNEEKDRVRQEEQRIANERAQLQAQYQRAQQPRTPSQDYAAAAQDFKGRAAQLLNQAIKEGATDEVLTELGKNLDIADKAMAEANKLWQQEQQEWQQANRERFEQTWKYHLQESIRTEPEIHKDGNPVKAQIEDLLGHPKYGPIIEAIPEGFQLAVEVAKLRVDASAASELREENKKLKAEREGYIKKTAPMGSGPTSAPSNKSFDDMSLDDQAKVLQRASEGTDFDNF